MLTYTEYLQRHSLLSNLMGEASRLARRLKAAGYEIAADDLRNILADLNTDRAALDCKWAREKVNQS